MRPLIKKTLLFGYVFTISLPLLLIPIGLASGYFVSQNFSLGLMEYDLIQSVLEIATLIAVGSIGIILLIVALSAHLADKLSQKLLMPHPKS
jgi:hypothetical protein